jgi:hypothetical protein
LNRSTHNNDDFFLLRTILIPRSSRSRLSAGRRFYLDGNVLLTAEYWEEGEYDTEPPPEHLFQEIAGNVRSRFFTMDIACDINGTWLIVELGDAQVAGLPEAINPSDFYRDILSACSATEKPRRTIPE